MSQGKVILGCRTSNLKIMFNTKSLQIVAALAVLVILSISCKNNIERVSGKPCGIGTNNHPNSSKYQRIVDKFIEAGVPGVSVTVISPEGTWSGTGGMADVQNKISLTPCNTLRVGSISKMFTAATILKLQEAGILNITDKINKYIPRSITDHIANANEVTIEQCMSHRSGITEYLTESTKNGILNLVIVKNSAEENLKLIYEKNADFLPGKGMVYTNSNYLLLSAVIKYATNKKAYDVVTEKIIAPLGLQNTFASTTIPNTLSKAYYDEKNNGIMKDVTYLDNNAMGGEGQLDGGIISNSYDVAKFLEALLTGKIISQQSLSQMQTFNDIPTDQLPPELQYYKQYGLGLMKAETDHGTAIGHNGDVYGFSGKAFYFPVQKITLVILLNEFSEKSQAVLNAKETFNYVF